MITYALTTLTRCKLALDVTGTASDTKLEMLVAVATDWIESLAGRKLVARNYNGRGSAFATTVTSEDYLYLSGSDQVRRDDGTYAIYLPQYPVVRAPTGLAFALESLASRNQGAGHASDTWETALTEGDDYTVDHDAGRLTLTSGGLLEGFENYRVTCTAGFHLGGAAPWVPSDLEMACIERVRQLLRDSRNVQSESIGTWSRTYSQKPDPLLEDVLGRYTRLSL